MTRSSVGFEYCRSAAPYLDSVGKALITLYLQGKAAAIALHHQKRSFHGGIIERPWLDNRTTPLFAHFFPSQKRQLITGLYCTCVAGGKKGH